MKSVLPLVLIGALTAGTAWAAGGSSSMDNSGSQSGSGMQSRQEHWNQSDIKQIQGKLKQQGYDVGQVDGVLGPTTQQALRQFQEDKGLQASGQPDQQTLAALNMQPGGTQQGQLPESGSRGSTQGGSQYQQYQGEQQKSR